MTEYLSNFVVGIFFGVLIKRGKYKLLSFILLVLFAIAIAIAVWDPVRALNAISTSDSVTNAIFILLGEGVGYAEVWFWDEWRRKK
jgi:uncharacterized membrane protein YoaK (UPF0700 family)